MRTFLERRRELQAEVPDSRLEEVRDEYRSKQRQVGQAYRRVRDLFHAFLREEPGYDTRHEVFVNGGHDLPLDYALTNWWSPLTLDEALNKWSNADDDHIGHYLRRQQAVLEAFEDWAGEERQDDADEPGSVLPTPAGAEPRVPDSRPSRGNGGLPEILNHPWVVTVVGGAIVAVIGVILTVWLS